MHTIIELERAINKSHTKFEFRETGWISVLWGYANFTFHKVLILIATDARNNWLYALIYNTNERNDSINASNDWINMLTNLFDVLNDWINLKARINWSMKFVYYFSFEIKERRAQTQLLVSSRVHYINTIITWKILVLETRPRSSSPLIVSRDSFSPWTWARFHTGGA